MSAGARLPLTIEAAGIGLASSGPTRAAASALFSAAAQPAHGHDETHHLKLRERERRELTPAMIEGARRVMREREMRSLSVSGR
jgi:hypothetical protein